MPDVSDIARMMSRKFSGSWNGSDRTTSPNSIANVAELARIDLAAARRSPSRRSGRRAWSSPARARPCRPTAAARRLRGCRRPGPCRRATATAMSTLRSPLRSPSGTSPIMPKSMKVSCHAGRPCRPLVDPALGGRRGVTKMLPGCGSAWKKPSREELVEHDRANSFATSAGSMPAARSAVDVVDLDRGHVFEGEHAAGGALPHDLGHARPARRRRSPRANRSAFAASCR